VAVCENDVVALKLFTDTKVRWLRLLSKSFPERSMPRKANQTSPDQERRATHLTLVDWADDGKTRGSIEGVVVNNLNTASLEEVVPAN
jgi:hypothetical protein